MSYDPYAGPQAPVPQAPSPPQAAGVPQPWDVDEVLTGAWGAFKANWAMLVVVHFVGELIASLPGFIPGLAVVTHAVARYSRQYWALEVPSMVVELVISTFFQVAFIRIWIKALRGEAPRFEDLFEGAPRFPALLATTFLTMLVTTAFTALLIVPGVIVALGLSLSSFYVVDQNMRPIDAMNASWKATTGHKGKIFMLALLGVLIVVAGCCACCIGIFAAIPILGMATATIYLRLSGRAWAAVQPA
jgi:uncharacterized membrane protein